jgi:hexulose-6-phosphate isomerase
MADLLSRRQVLHSGLVATLAAALPTAAPAVRPVPKLKKAIKYSMVSAKVGSHRQRFELVKAIGFEGVELDSPNNYKLEEILEAKSATGIAIHGVIDSIHWNKPFSHPSEAVRTQAHEGIKTAINDCKAYGGDTVLVVPGVVNKDNGDFDTVWKRSQEELKRAVPLADAAGVKIAIEVVWNNFITTPEQLIKYVDSFGTPTVGAYFDCSNMIKFGVKSGDWIRQLGKRMLKFDFKGYSKAKAWVPIGEGDEDWPDVLRACEEVGYHSWATAEVAGGGEKELRDVYQRMVKIFDGQ